MSGLVLSDLVGEQRIIRIPSGIGVVNAEIGCRDLVRTGVVINLGEELLIIRRSGLSVNEFAGRIGCRRDLRDHRQGDRRDEAGGDDFGWNRAIGGRIPSARRAAMNLARDSLLKGSSPKFTFGLFQFSVRLPKGP